MNANQRSQDNKQTSNGGNEKPVSSSRGGTVEKDNMNPAGIPPTGGQSQQSGTLGGAAKKGGTHLAADQDMDEDTGLSNRANRQSAPVDEGSRQSEQSNVGRRSDGTPD